MSGRISDFGVTDMAEETEAGLTASPPYGIGSDGSPPIARGRGN